MQQVGISSANAQGLVSLVCFCVWIVANCFIHFSLHLFEGFDDYLEVILSLMYISPFIKRNYYPQQILHPQAFRSLHSLFAICFVLNKGNLRNWYLYVNMFIFHFKLYVTELSVCTHLFVFRVACFTLTVLCIFGWERFDHARIHSCVLWMQERRVSG